MIMLMMVLCTMTSHAIAPTPIEPTLWGPNGVAVADHTDGQLFPSTHVWRDTTYIAWQDDTDGDTDIAFQRLTADGTRCDGDNGRRIARDGMQTLPSVTHNGLIYAETVDATQWFVQWMRFNDRTTDVSGAMNSIIELRACAVSDGIFSAWISLHDYRSRQINASFATKDGDVIPLAVCYSDGYLADLRIQQSGRTLFLSWTDYRDNAHPHIYAQAIDIPTATLLFPDNGMDVTPTVFMASRPQLAQSHDDYVAVSYMERRGDEQVICLQTIDWTGAMMFDPAIDISRCDDDTRTHDSTAFAGGTFVAWNEDDELRSRIIAFDGTDLSGTWVDVMWMLYIDDITVVANDRYAWLAWTDNRHERYDRAVLVQKFNADNMSQWREGGIQTTQSHGQQRRPGIVADSHACCVVWEEPCGYNHRMMTQRME